MMTIKSRYPKIKLAAGVCQNDVLPIGELAMSNNTIFAFPPAAQPVVPVAGEQILFPVRRIFCVGQNYAAHAREMGGDPDRQPPFFFCKPSDGLVPIANGCTGDVAYPSQTVNLHHEVELVVAIGKGGKDIIPADAAEHVWGYALGLDLTRRDLQADLKAKGRPWEMAKAFDQSAPISPLVRSKGLLTSGAIWLDVNGQRRQSGDLADMIWSIAETIGHLSKFVELAAGDLIFTGTPEGVGQLQRGDVVTAAIDHVAQLSARIV
jgi:fumarylpyruvate hydrolase